jgi:hypothetical protein
MLKHLLVEANYSSTHSFVVGGNKIAAIKNGLPNGGICTPNFQIK